MPPTAICPPRREAFDAHLRTVLEQARSQGRTFIDIRAGDLHHAVGGYPPARGQHHRMPQAVLAMRALAATMPSEVLESPPKGAGASLKIRYFLS